MLKRFLSDMLKDALPKKTKRQIFLVSFAALLKGATTYDQETFHKLNNLLALSESNDDALAVPVILSKIIWSGKTSEEICQDNVMEGSFAADRISKIVNNILSFLPVWLRYGERDEIEADLSVILQNRMNLLGA